VAESIVGMMSGQAVSWAGAITLGELGALCELANLYVGNDTGPTHISAAMGCTTVAIYGPSNPQISAPYSPQKEHVIILRHAQE
jgi:ADP-heptose:LPS heptosyltransferase